MKKFLLVDGHDIVRSGIRGLLYEIFNPSEIHETAEGNGAIEKVKNHQYDLIIMDIKMVKTNALSLMEFIHANYPAAKVLIFSMRAENIYAPRFLKAGASGYLSKEAPLEEIKKAINLTLNGGTYISEPLARLLDRKALHKVIQ